MATIKSAFQRLVPALRKARVAVTPRTATLTTHLVDGSVIRGRNRPGFGGRGIYILREEYEPEFSLLATILQPGWVFLDVGANVGVYSVRAGRLVGGHGVVVAFEPFPQTAAQLLDNVRLNGLRNVRVRVLCAGDRTGPSQLFLIDDKPNSFSLMSDPDAAVVPRFPPASMT